MKHKAGFLLGAAVAVYAFPVAPASAQDVAAAKAQATSPDPAPESGDIVVTATRRSESIQRIGLSITALGAQELDNKGVQSFFDYGTAVPNLSFASTGLGSLGSRSIAIRGVQGADTTGFYIDETPVPDSVDPRVIDIARIEVLRGPQGTLYGARSEGGTVRLITEQPELTKIAGRVHAGVSFTDQGGANYLADGSINVPLVEGKIGLRATAFYQFDEGVFDKAIGPLSAPATSLRKNVDDLSAAGGQIALRFEPASDLVITPRFLYQKVRQSGFPYADVTPENFVQRRDFDIPEGGYDEWKLYTLNASLKTRIGTFTSATSYFDRRTPESEDYTTFTTIVFGLSQALPSRIDRNVKLRRFVQENRFASDFSGPFQIIAGAFYSDTKQNELFDPPSIIPGLDAAFGGGVAPGDLAIFTDRATRTKEFAVYGEASIKLTPRLKLTAGGRYFRNTQRYNEQSDGLIIGGPVTLAPPTTRENGFNPKGSIEFQATPDVLIYGTASRGYRVGGFNGFVASSCDADIAALGLQRKDTVSFRSDNLWSYEAGIKSKFADRRVTLNAAVFRIDWNKIQQIVLPACGFPFTINSGKARSQGFELEVNLRPVDGLTAGLNLGYTDAKVTDPGNAPIPSGTPVYQVPKWTASGNAEYATHMVGPFDGFVRGDISYVDQSFSANNDVLNPRRRPSYTLVDLRLGIRSERMELALYGKNLGNVRANLADNRSIAAEAPGLPRIVTNRPRTIGIEGRLNF
jgi:outer membrane receptor protein involved in Fe transport